MNLAPKICRDRPYSLAKQVQICVENNANWDTCQEEDSDYDGQFSEKVFLPQYVLSDE